MLCRPGESILSAACSLFNCSGLQNDPGLLLCAGRTFVDMALFVLSAQAQRATASRNVAGPLALQLVAAF